MKPCRGCGGAVPRSDTQFCSRVCYKRWAWGPNAPHWEGGTTVNLGYRFIRRIAGEGRRYIQEHRAIAERALGHPLPVGAEIHHVNEDRGDNGSRGNLVVCPDRAYHMLLHARMRILKAGGQPRKDKICSSCRLVKSREVFVRNRRLPDGLYSRCRSCHAKYQRHRGRHAAMS